MKGWTEGHIHVAMRKALRDAGFRLLAGEYPGGSDHELYPLNVTDPTVARDNSPDPRRHSTGELIPDIVALKGRTLLLGEAKVHYSDADRIKLETLTGDRIGDLETALEKFAIEHGFADVLPFQTLVSLPVLVFTTQRPAPARPRHLSYLRFDAGGLPIFEGPIETVVELRCA